MKFILTTLACAFILIGVVWTGVQLSWFQEPSMYRPTTLFTAIVMYVSYNKLHRISSPELFVKGYLLSIVMQMILLLAYISTISFLDRPGIIPNVVWFLINAFIFIGIQVFFLFVLKNNADLKKN